MMPWSRRTKATLDQYEIWKQASKDRDRVKTSKFGFINKPAFLWFLSTVIVGVATATIQRRSECLASQATSSARIDRLANEVINRSIEIGKAITGDNWSDVSKLRGRDADYIYIENKGFTYGELL
jgi:hypothetical protein